MVIYKFRAFPLLILLYGAPRKRCACPLLCFTWIKLFAPSLTDGSEVAETSGNAEVANRWFVLWPKRKNAQAKLYEVADWQLLPQDFGRLFNQVAGKVPSMLCQQNDAS